MGTSLLILVILWPPPHPERVYPVPPLVRPKLVVYIDRYVEREQRFRDELTVRWRDRIPDALWRTYSREDYLSNRAFCEAQDVRVRTLRQYFDISFEERVSREFSIRVNHGLSIELPNDDRMLKTTMPIRVVEYLYESYYRDAIMEATRERQYAEWMKVGVSLPEAKLRFPLPQIPASPLVGLDVNQDLLDEAYRELEEPEFGW